MRVCVHLCTARKLYTVTFYATHDSSDVIIINMSGCLHRFP